VGYIKDGGYMLDSIDLDHIVSIAQEAGSAIMEIYDRDFEIEYKDDSSPLTEADIRSNEIICRRLKESYPDINILSEESSIVDYDTRVGWEYFWMIDPIDGTKEFIKKSGEFTVNIALIDRDRPILGVVYAPLLGDIYKAKRGVGAFKNGQRMPIVTNGSRDDDTLRVVASKSHLNSETQEFIDELSRESKRIELCSKGSSLKLVMVAEGIADIYPRLAPTMEWDTAAADAIVIESGKRSYIYDPNKKEYHETLKYNKRDLLNPWFVVK